MKKHDVDRPGKPDSTFLELACLLLYIRERRVDECKQRNQGNDPMRRNVIRPKRRETSAMAAGLVAFETSTSTACDGSPLERASTP